MNRPLAALAAAAMLAASVPSLGFAEESSSDSASSMSSESSSESSASSEASSSSSSSASSMENTGPAWMKPCLELTGLKKAQCITKHNPGKKAPKKDRILRRTEDKALRLNTDCSQKQDMARVKCLRTSGKKGIKTLIRKVDNKRDLIRTIRGKKIETPTSR